MTKKVNVNHAEKNFLIPTTLNNVLSDFLTDRDISGVRPATLSFYSRELEPFIHWLAAAGANVIEDITPDLLRAYFLDLRQRRSQNGIHKNYSVVKTWLIWAWNEYDQAAICPITKVKVASAKVEPQPAISLENFQKLLDVCKDRNQKRDKAILLFLLDTGVRRQELCRLKLSAIRKNGMVILGPGDSKTGESGKVFLVRETLKAIYAYLLERENLDPDSPLFATEQGTAFTPSGIRQIIRRKCLKAGISEQGMHSFRRGFALETWRTTHDLEATSRLLRHRNTATTRRYLPLEDDDLKQVHERSSPINKLKLRKR